MRRIKLFLLVTAAVASLLAMNAGPALADDGCIGVRKDGGECIGVGNDRGDGWRDHWNDCNWNDCNWNDNWNDNWEVEDCFWWDGWLICEVD